MVLLEAEALGDHFVFEGGHVGCFVEARAQDGVDFGCDADDLVAEAGEIWVERRERNAGTA